MTYHDRVKRTYERAKSDDRFGEAVAFKAACLTNMSTAAEADAEVSKLRSALAAIAGDLPWPDSDMGFVDLARSALSIKEADVVRFVHARHGLTSVTRVNIAHRIAADIKKNTKGDT